MIHLSHTLLIVEFACRALPSLTIASHVQTQRVLCSVHRAKLVHLSHQHKTLVLSVQLIAMFVHLRQPARHAVLDTQEV